MFDLSKLDLVRVTVDDLHPGDLFFIESYGYTDYWGVVVEVDRVHTESVVFILPHERYLRGHSKTPNMKTDEAGKLSRFLISFSYEISGTIPLKIYKLR